MSSDQKNAELDEKKYRSFLLRLWQVDVEETRAWRFSLEDPSTGKRRGFITITDLLDFLSDQICDKEVRAGNKFDTLED